MTTGVARKQREGRDGRWEREEKGEMGREVLRLVQVTSVAC